MFFSGIKSHITHVKWHQVFKLSLLLLGWRRPWLTYAIVEKVGNSWHECGAEDDTPEHERDAELYHLNPVSLERNRRDGDVGDCDAEAHQKTCYARVEAISFRNVLKAWHQELFTHDTLGEKKV